MGDDMTPIKIDVNRMGCFINWQQGVGYLLDLVGHKTGLFGGQTPMYRFDQNRNRPFMFRQDDGTMLMPADGIPTDYGTVKPIVAQYWIAKDRFTCAFLVHDSIYSTGGCWIKKPGSYWRWIKLTRSQADALLRTMCICDPHPCGWWKPRIVWAGVRAGGWVGWRGNERIGSDPNTWDEIPDVDDGLPMGVWE